jgi:hypothetical protein
MWETLPAILPFLIPILGILLGGMVVAGIFVVQPLVRALEKLADAPNRGPAGAAHAEMEERLSRVEDHLQRLEARQEFDRALGSGPDGERRPGR